MKFKSLLLSTIFAMGCSTAAFGYSITGGTDVGGLDTWVAQTTQSDIGNSGDSTVKAWVENQLGFAVSYEGKTDPIDVVYSVEDAAIAILSLFSSPDYFLVKDSKTYVLFSNNGSLDWGVFKLGDYFKDGKVQLSHVSEFNGNTVTVAEPGTLALLGLGLLGLLIGRSRIIR